VTSWNPPRMFAAQGEGWGGSPPIATEWSVEASAGGVCLVRVVNSLFASTDDWDNQLEGTESGWPGFFRTLRIYLTHFRGQRSAIMQFVAGVAGTEAEAWETLTAALGLKGLSVGQHWTAPAGVPALGGVAEYVTQSPYDALLRLDKPGPGVAAFGAFNFGGQSMVALNVYLYGDQAAGTVAREKPLCQARASRIVLALAWRFGLAAQTEALPNIHFFKAFSRYSNNALVAGSSGLPRSALILLCVVSLAPKTVTAMPASFSTLPKRWACA